MRCERARVLLVDALTDCCLDAPRHVQLEEHLQGCAACREESLQLEALWQDLGDLAEQGEPVPSQRLTARFAATLAELEEERRSSPGERLAGWVARWWPAAGMQPLVQLTAAVVLLVAGIVLGATGARLGGSAQEIRQLQADLRSMSHTVAVSLLEHQSASERLRGVSWSRRTEADRQVLDALLQVVRFDTNTNVRLAAVEALADHCDRPAVRAGLISSLPAQPSPMVQLAVLEAVLAGNGGGNGKGELQRLLQEDTVDDAVLEYVMTVQQGSSGSLR